MKTLAALALVMGLTTQVFAEPLLSDIATYEALVIDEASGQTIATGGPWVWEDPSIQTMAGNFSGPGRTIVVKCRNEAGQTIFGGMITGADLTPPQSPFDPPNPSGVVTLTFLGEENTFVVFLNDRYYVGGLILLPAEDPEEDPFEAVVVDIKPGSTENPFNVDSNGQLPVAVLGSEAVDLSQVVPSTLRLAGVSPVRQGVTDLQADGFADLVLHFRSEDIAGLLTDTTDGEVVGLTFTGTLQDGTQIQGTDTITIIRKPLKKR